MDQLRSTGPLYGTAWHRVGGGHQRAPPLASYLSTAQVAAALGVPRERVRALVLEGKLKGVGNRREDLALSSQGTWERYAKTREAQAR